MKLLSYRLNDKIYFGPKVKKEEAVWDVLSIQETLQVLPEFPATIVEGVGLGMDFIEQIRKLVEAALKEENANDFKKQFTEIEWLSPIPRTPKNIMAIGKNYAEHAKEMGGVANDFVVFTKSPTSIAADEQTLSIHADKTDAYDY